jgi:hypothetical protein
VLDYKDLKYNPCNDIIIPSVIRTDDLQKPLGRYYMYYAPHNPPGGICLAYADAPEGPWKEYEANPLIARDWPPHYKVSHVSGPHAIWIEEEKKLFVYYHGENDITRFASTKDGVHFQYEGVAFTTKLFHDVSEASYARMFRYTIPGKDNRYIALLMGNNQGTRRIYLAWSKDGRRWEPRQTPLVDPPPGTGQVTQAWYLPWQGKHYLIYHAHLLAKPLIADLHVSEVDPAMEHAKYLGLFYDHTSASPDNVAQMSPCFLTRGDTIYMYTNIGPRLNQKIALALAAEPESLGVQHQPAPSVTLTVTNQPGQTLEGFGCSMVDLSRTKMPDSARAEMFDQVFGDLHMNVLRLWAGADTNRTAAQMKAAFYHTYVDSDVIAEAQKRGVTTLLLAPARGEKPPIEPMPDYARKLAEFIQGVKAERGIRINVTGIANEPAGFKPDQMAEAVRILRQELDARCLQDVQIIAPEWSSADNSALRCIAGIKADPAAWAALRGIATHSYNMAATPEFPKILSSTDKQYWMTEASDNGCGARGPQREETRSWNDNR